MLKLERSYYSDEVALIVGVDEAGRGPLAGPVYAAAVVFPPNYKNAKINDSKKLTAKEREALFPIIKKKALGYGIASVSAEDIDRLNIYEATKVAMKAAIAQIAIPYDLILTDAMPFQGLSVKVVPIIKGDAQCLNIAAASILAKVSRDHYMDELDAKYPQYDFKKHKGYSTKEHLAALAKYGPIPGVHRKTFRPVSSYYEEQMKLF
jgi:ribonuclease HII